jgi:hypothetical protein
MITHTAAAARDTEGNNHLILLLLTLVVVAVDGYQYKSCLSTCAPNSIAEESMFKQLDFAIFDEKQLRACL